MVKIEKDNSLTISGFEGIGQSVLSDFSDALGVNLELPGIIGVGYKFNKLIETKSAVNFTIARCWSVLFYIINSRHNNT